MEEFEILQKKSDLVKTEQWKEIRKNQIEMIIGFSMLSTFEASDIKAMLKLIGKTDNWEQEYKKIRNKKVEENK